MLYLNIEREDIKMKIKGLKSKVTQVSFEEIHPTTGLVTTITWERLARHLEKQNKGLKIRSFRVTSSGLDTFLNDDGDTRGLYAGNLKSVEL
jgi:hypothetical protein